MTKLEVDFFENATDLAMQQAYVSNDSTQTLISAAAGTIIGNYSDRQANAFDGVTDASDGNSCYLGSGETLYIGKDWGVGGERIVSGFKAYGSNDVGFSYQSNPSITVTLQGSTDNFSSSIVDLGSVGPTTDANSLLMQKLTGITVTTAYRYHRLKIENGTPTNQTDCAEVQFYGETLQSYSESTIKTQGSYALKAVAAITDSLNKTLTHTFASPLDLSGINNLKFDMRSTRTGVNVKVGLRNHNTDIVDQEDTTVNDYNTFGDSGGVEYRQAQSFILSGAVTLTAAEVRRDSVTGGSPTGNWTLRIETDSSGLPSGTLANANASIVVTPPAINTIIKGTFATPFALSASTTYWLVVQCDNQADNVRWTLSSDYHPSGGGYANGNFAMSTNGVWNAGTTSDLYFRIYVQNYVTTELTPTINSADTYETKTWDLSGVSDASKDAIDTLIITVTNAVAANTFYLDNFGISQGVAIIDVFGWVG